MLKQSLLMSLLLMAAARSTGDDIIKEVTAHCPDQQSPASNDAKPVFGDRKLGQTFTPARGRLSFFKVKAVRTKESAGGVTVPEAKLWECGGDYKQTTAQPPAAAAAEDGTFFLGNALFFGFGAETKPQCPYYAEISSASAAAPYYNIGMQYGGDPYPGGNFVGSDGHRWGTSDLCFASCYPADISGPLPRAPELLEIQFSRPMSAEKTKVSLESTGVPAKPLPSVWRGKTRLFIVPDKVAAGKIKIKAVAEDGASESREIPFTAASATEPAKETESSPKDRQNETRTISAGKIIKGIPRARVSDLKVNGQAEFTVSFQTEPVVGMQTGFNDITLETIRVFKDSGVNTVSIVPPVKSLESVPLIKSKTDLLHKNGFLILWLAPLAPAGYDTAIMRETDKSACKINWKEERLKEPCFNNPLVQKAFLSNMEKWMDAFLKAGVKFDGVIMNEPGSQAGEFCYCPVCKEKFKKEYGRDMPEPVSATSPGKAIPVRWPSGIPVAANMRPEDEDSWKKMSDFYCAPVTERIREIFKIFRQTYPDISCQITTLTDIAQYYGLDWKTVSSLPDTSGIQTAIYWAVGGHSPATVGAPGTAKKFITDAHDRKISCYYWLQGYDAGDKSSPLKPGDIKVAVDEAFARGVDGILIWSYLNPILGPWDRPFHWPEYIKEFKEAVAPHLGKDAVPGGKVKLSRGESKSLVFKGPDGEPSYTLDCALSNDGTLSTTVKRDGFPPVKDEIKLSAMKKQE